MRPLRPLREAPPILPVTVAAVAAIVVAGGSSQRMGFDKLTADLAGLPVYLHSLQTLQHSPDIGQIILVASPQNLPAFQLATRHLSKLTHLLPGGAQRHLSVAAGLEKVASTFTFVAVHDAARPLLSPYDLQAVLAAAREHGAASLASPVTDTLQRTDDSGIILERVDRTRLWTMQTPQVFHLKALREAYQNILTTGETVTDEASAVAKMGVRVKLLAARDLNFKITYPCDIALARLALPSLSAVEKQVNQTPNQTPAPA